VGGLKMIGLKLSVLLVALALSGCVNYKGVSTAELEEALGETAPCYETAIPGDCE